MTTSTLKINELTKRYDRTTAVAPCSLCLPQGGFTSILGPSGCGKTTMLMMIAGVVEPSGGQVWLDGEDITHVPLEKRGIGIVFQHYALFSQFDGKGKCTLRSAWEGLEQRNGCTI